MSQQFNFFAANNDQKVLCETIVSVLGKIYIIPERGTIIEMVPQPISKADELYSQSLGDLVCIIQEDFLHLLELEEISNNLYYINFRSFPCLEYSLSKQVSQGVLKIGRIVYFFAEDNPFKIKVQKLMRVLKKKSLQLEGKKGLWIFEDTAKKTENLQYAVGQPKKNPMYKKT